MSALRPCPFCGSHNGPYRDCSPYHYYVRCRACGTRGPEADDDENGEDVTAWNSRAESEELEMLKRVLPYVDPKVVAIEKFEFVSPDNSSVKMIALQELAQRLIDRLEGKACEAGEQP